MCGVSMMGVDREVRIPARAVLENPHEQTGAPGLGETRGSCAML